MSATACDKKRLGAQVLAIDQRSSSNGSSSFDEFEYIDIASVDRDEKAIVGTTLTSAPDAPSRARQIVRANDVLVSTVRPNLNAVAVVPEKLCGAIASTGFCVLRSHPDRLCPRYLYHWVRTPYFVADMVRKATGASYPAVSDAIIKDSLIPFPPLSEQKQIADILDKADSICRKRRRVRETTSALIFSCFRELFGDAATNPMEWPTPPLKSLISQGFQNGAYYKKEEYVSESSGGTNMVHMADAFYGIVQTDGLKRVKATQPDIAKYGLTQNDLLVARRSLNYEGSAKPCRFPRVENDLIFESSLIRVTSDQTRLLPLYLYYFLSEPRARAKFVFPHVTRSTISGINQAGLGRVPVVLPPIALQRKFVSMHSRISKAESNWDLGVKRTDDLFYSLVQRAFKGEL